jgi:hypothetical protein
MAQLLTVVDRFAAHRGPLVWAAAAVLVGALAGGSALAQTSALAPAGEEAEMQAAVADPAWPYSPPPAEAGAVPPQVEAAPIATMNGAYCFAGPHPTDPRFAAGASPYASPYASWDDSPGVHAHEYPPLDLRLFAFQNGCYHFVGDPGDFGYRGQTFAYYGAHPVLSAYGGGWCYMIGGHHHMWRPWSPYFVVAGPWYYWQGAYDRVFWNYWPYYATYYRHHYPTYYRAGRFARGGWTDRGRGGYAVAPPIGRVAGPAIAGPVGPAGRLHFGRPVPAPAAGSPSPAPAVAGREPRAGWGQQNPGWGQQTSGWGQAWGTARPSAAGDAAAVAPQVVRPTAAPAPAPRVALPGVGWSANRPSFPVGRPTGPTGVGAGPAVGGFRPAPVQPSGPGRTFAAPMGAGSVHHSGPAAPSGFGGFHRR